MKIKEVRLRLHEAIEQIVNEELLKAVLTIFNQSYQPEKYRLSKEQIRLLEKREIQYLTGQDKGISFEEFKKKMRERYGL